MSLRKDLLRAATRAQRHGPDVAERVAAFLDSRAGPGGGFCDRAGRDDLYYTVFAMQGLKALDAPLPGDSLRGYLTSFGAGESLDFVHLACLARCWSMVADGEPPSPDARAAILRRLETWRSLDGGYHPTAGVGQGTASAAFLALGAYQDLALPLPDPDRLLHSVRLLRLAKGGYTNTPRTGLASTPATAAAFMVLTELAEPVDPADAAWLSAQLLPDGGFCAMPAVPVPDLLSTATALHALASAGGVPAEVQAPCLAFVRALWSDAGGFQSHADDPALDCEYTFYGLLALGHLPAQAATGPSDSA